MYDRGHAGTETGEADETTSLVTRRTVLAGGAAVAFGSLAGCTGLDDVIDRASEQAIGTRTASPAGFYAGDVTDDPAAFTSGPVDVRFVPPALQVDSQRIEIDGWSTVTTTAAKDLNSSRSNKPRSIWVPDTLDPDSDGDGLPTLVTVLDIERALLVYADAAIAAVERQSPDEATASLEAFVAGATTVQNELDGCPSETCASVREHADVRKGLARDASAAVAAGEWDDASRSLQQARRIVQGDIDDISDDLDSDDDGLLDGTESLYEYLDGEPTIGERFVVSLPDASVRGGGPALADELTPARVMAYFTGEQNAESCGNSDRTVAIHRDLSCRDLLTAQLEEESAKRRRVAAFETSGGVVVTGATPAADVAEPMLWITPTNAVSSDDSLDSWGEEASSGDATVSSALVCPVVATLADCPCPLPALFHVRRIRREDQLLFVGGWTLDDGALYDGAATLLVADGPNVVAGVTRSDISEGGVDLRSRVEGRKRPGRTKFGDITLKKGYDRGAPYLPPGAYSVCGSDGDVYCWGVQSREALAGHDTGDCDDGDRDVRPSALTTALDAPVLHLAQAADASNDVKFKAGAELSKAVN
jgi:hypothetical protein